MYFCKRRSFIVIDLCDGNATRLHALALVLLIRLNISGLVLDLLLVYGDLPRRRDRLRLLLRDRLRLPSPGDFALLRDRLRLPLPGEIALFALRLRLLLLRDLLRLFLDLRFRRPVFDLVLELLPGLFMRLSRASRTSDAPDDARDRRTAEFTHGPLMNRSVNTTSVPSVAHDRFFIISYYN